MANYFVSTSGSDSNNGTSAATPWLTVNKVNSGSYYPGDTISFYSPPLNGASTVYSGYTLALTTTNYAYANSTSSNPLTITSYGGGIAEITNGNSSAITMTDVGGLNINNLRLLCANLGDPNLGAGNASLTPSYVGVITHHSTSTPGSRVQNVSITNCKISGAWTGAYFYADNVNVTSGLNGINITNCQFSSHIGFAVYTEQFTGGDHNSQGNASTWHFSGISCQENYVNNCYGNHASSWQSATGNGICICSADAAMPLETILEPMGRTLQMQTYGSTPTNYYKSWQAASQVRSIGTIIRYNYVDQNGLYGQQPAGIYGESSIGVDVSWNIVSRQAGYCDTSDCHAFNIGSCCSDWYVQNNIGWGCCGWGCQIDGNSGSDGIQNTSNTVRFNAFLCNGVYNPAGGGNSGMTPTTAGGGITTLNNGQANRVSDANYCYIYGNTFVGAYISGVVLGIGAVVIGDGNYLLNNIFAGAWFNNVQINSNNGYPKIIGNIYTSTSDNVLFFDLGAGAYFGTAGLGPIGTSGTLAYYSNANSCEIEYANTTGYGYLLYSGSTPAQTATIAPIPPAMTNLAYNPAGGSNPTVSSPTNLFSLQIPFTTNPYLLNQAAQNWTSYAPPAGSLAYGGSGVIPWVTAGIINIGVDMTGATPATACAGCVSNSTTIAPQEPSVPPVDPFAGQSSGATGLSGGNIVNLTNIEGGNIVNLTGLPTGSVQ